MRIHLQDLDIRASQIHPKPDPPDAGTEHLEHGETLLRLKGIVDVAGAQTPASVHAVQHLVERPRLLATMPAEPWRGIVAICRRQARNGIADRLGQVLRASTADRAEIHREHA
ncbi:GTP-binding protein (plasmid) [Shinella sp. PSBB067]|nr:GTP-binding protein [Shinella sp. PSBB067]